MKCQYCGAIIDDDSRFCPECGKEQVPAQPPVKLCPFCRAELEEDSVSLGLKNPGRQGQKRSRRRPP